MDHRPHFRRLRLALAVSASAVIAVLLPLGSRAGAQEPPGGEGRREHSPAAGINYVIRTLADEARASLKERRLVRGAPDYAIEYGGVLPAELLSQRMARRLDRDPFVDAYIRWQLTSFPEAALPQMNDRQFEKFLADLPPLLENPRADAGLINAINAAVQVGQLSPQQQEAHNARLNDLSDRTSAASTFNQPAMALRIWTRERLKDSPARALHVEIDQCGVLAQAGWPVEQAKNALERSLEQAARDRAFTDEDRRRVAAHAQAMIGRKRLFVAAAGIRENAATVEYADTGIYDFDVRRWQKIIGAE